MGGVARGDLEAGRRHFEIHRLDRVGKAVAVFDQQSDPTLGTRRPGAGDVGYLRLLQRYSGGTAGGIGDGEDLRAQHVIELQPAGPRPGIGVVDDQVVDLDRIMGVGKIMPADDHGIAVGVGVDEQRALLVEVKAALGRAGLPPEHRISSTGAEEIDLPSMIAPIEIRRKPVSERAL